MGSLLDAVQLRKRLFDVHEYHRLGETGILGPDDRVELVEGELVEMPPIGDEHVTLVSLLNRSITPQCDDSQIVHVQNPLRLSGSSEPQPDLVLARYERGLVEIPSAADALLVIEVADTTYNYDRKVKAKLYASAAVPELWIFDCQNKRVEVHRDPRGDEYRDVTIAASDSVLTPSKAPNIRVPLKDLWPA
jgi:Uma2 family endonuclease